MDRATRERHTSRRMLSILATMGLLAGVLAIVGSPVGAQGSIPPGTNGKIAFGRGDEAIEGHRIFTIDPDGTNEVQIPVGVECTPRWSPNSSKLLVCAENARGFIRPATTNPDGSDSSLLDAYPHLKLNLATDGWSPDGSRLLLRSEGNRNPDKDGVYTVRSSDGGDLAQVTSTPPGFFDLPVGYSPDGSRILFDRIGDGDLGNLFAVNPNGTGLLQLNPTGLPVVFSDFDSSYDCCGTAADWSPDGSQVAFAAIWKLSNRGHGTALFVVNADGTGLLRITPFGVGAGTGAKWSPDGQLIAFSDKFRSGAQIYVVHPDGTGLRGLTSNSVFSVGPVWSPDSTKLLFQSSPFGGQADLWTVNVDGTGLTQLTNPVDGLIGEALPAWGTAPVG